MKNTTKGNDIKVISKRDYIVRIKGKYAYVINQMAQFKNGVKGIVIKAENDTADIALLEDSLKQQVVTGDTVTMLPNEIFIKPHEKMLGSIVNIYGDLVYGNIQDVNITKVPAMPIFRMARPIYSRDYVNRPLYTGLTAVDWAIPIGMGQRELVLGDRKTGKTSMALNMILAQRNTKVKCVYVSIGQKKSSLIDIYKKLDKQGMMDRTVIVAASSDDTATRKYLVPYTGVTIAEYFQEKLGDDVLIIYDDLSKHADAYREISLLLESAPAREAYPGDVFYLHSKLLERAGSFAKEFGSGSITAIPIIQTEAEDITSYIPTNVISITDGQIFTSKTLFNAGNRPAIDVAYSVSRVGSTAQLPTMRKIAGGLKLIVSQYNEVMKLAKLSPQAAEENKDIIVYGNTLLSLFRQGDLEVIDYEAGILLLILFKKGYFGFYEKDEEIIEIKRIINTFMAKSSFGKKLSKLLATKEYDEKKINLIIDLFVLPLVKYHIINKFPELKERAEFADLFGAIRDDSRVYKAVEKNINNFGDGPKLSDNRESIAKEEVETTPADKKVTKTTTVVTKKVVKKIKKNKEKKGGK
ncbi:MAG: F0F1 ATP synthase subunit alpha [Mycoplasmataceae bacterium]|nr:F0F1 ATP synthase subunit alpha [Mycoplasmataceae bacterium]